MENAIRKLTSLLKRGKGIKKGGLKLPIAMLLLAMLVVGGGIAYQAWATSVFTVSISPNAVDIGQTTDMDFNITASGSKIKTIAVSVKDTGFTGPTDFICPSGWNKIDAMPPILNGYVCDDPNDTGLANPVVTLLGLTAPTTAGAQNFSVSAINTDTEPQTENRTVVVTVKNLSATATVIPTTTNTEQERIYTFTVTNDGGNDSDTIKEVEINVPSSFTGVSGANSAGWTCDYASPAITCMAVSSSELANEGSVSFNVTATAPTTVPTTAMTVWATEVTGSLGGSQTVSGSPTITVQTPPNIEEIATTISPATVSQGQAGVSFSVNVKNTGEVDVVLDTGSTISFTDGTNTYSALLTGTEIERTVAGNNGTATLIFTATDINAEMFNQSYDPILTLSGTDANTAVFSQTIDTESNQITVQTPASLSVGNIFSDVPAISKQSGAVNTATISIPVTNSGEATAVISAITVQVFDQAGTQNNISGDFTIIRTDSIGNDIDGSKTLTYTITPTSSETYEGLVDVNVTIDYKDENTGDPLLSVSGSEVGIFEVDNTSPSITSPVITPTSPINTNTPIITFNVSDTGVGINWATVKINDVSIDISECTLASNVYSCSHAFSALADGTYTFTISAGDNVGNSASDSSLAGYVIDTVNPDTTDDYGDKDGVWQKIDQTITLTPSDPILTDGTPSSGVAWTKYCTDTVNTCVPDMIGNSLTISTKGTTYFRYASADLAGNIQDTVSLVVMIDKTNPATSVIESPTASSYIKGTVAITATATDNSGGSGIAKVEFYHGENLIGTDSDNTDSTYSINWDTTGLNDVYSLIAVAIDEAGNTLTSSVVSVNVDNTSPEITNYTLQVDGSTATTENNVFINSSTGAKINIGTSEEVIFEIWISNTNISLNKKYWHTTVLSNSITRPTDCFWGGTVNSCSGDVLADGVYTIKVIMTDKAGTVVTDTSKTITIDNTSPTVDAGADVATNQVITQTGTATDSDSGIASVLWSQVSGPTDGVAIFGSASDLTTTISANIEGKYILQLTAVDDAGNSQSDTMEFIWDIQHPGISNFSSPVADTVYTTEVSLTFTATDANLGICSYTIDNGTPYSVDCLGGTIIVANLIDGRNAVVLTATDEAGNTVSEDSVSFVYNDDQKLTVAKTGNPDFTTIQGAIDEATINDTISVAEGDYNENLVIDEKLTLNGAQHSVTAVGRTGDESIINALIPSDYVVNITANEVTLDGFTITGYAATETGSNGAVNINAKDYCIIANNILTDNRHNAINLHSTGGEYSDHNTVSNNVINAPNGYETYGIKIRGASNTISGNHIYNADTSIHIWSWNDSETASPDNNTISGNTIAQGVGGTANHKFGIEIKTGQHNKVTGNIISVTSAGIHLYTSSAMVAETNFDPRPANNTISGNKITGGEVGICLLEGANTNTISNNDISGTSIAGILGSLSRWPTDWSDSPSTHLQGTPQQYLQITNNTFTDNTLDNCGHGIAMEYADNNIIGIVDHGNIIKKNVGDAAIAWPGFSGSKVTFTADYAGVYFDANSEGNVVNYNTIIDNNGGLGNGNTATLDAKNNWWGASSGPSEEGNGAGDKVSANVDFDPWYIDDGKTILSDSVSLGIVYVDDGYDVNACDLAGHVWNLNCFDTIQEGVNAVKVNGTVDVAAGTYDELLTINVDGLTLLGAQASTDPRPMNGGRNGAESIIQKIYTTTSALNPIKIEANNVTINGFTISPHYEASVVNLNKDIIKQESPTSGFWTGTAIKYNILTATGNDIVNNCDELVQLKGVTGAVIEYNYGYHTAESESGGNAFNIADSENSAIQFNEAHKCGDYQYNKWGGAIYTYNSNNISIIRNKIVNGGGITFGVSKDASEESWVNNRNTSGTIKNNIIEDSGFGLEIFADGVTVSGNDVTKCDEYALNIIGQDVTVQDNKYNNNGTGILIEDKATVSSTGVSINTNKIYNNTFGLNNLTTAKVDATGNWWGDASGPSGQGNGAGDAVSTIVDFDPWYTVPDTSTTLDEAAPTAVLPDAVSPISDKTISLTVSGDQVVYYKYNLGGGTYGVETAVATLITKSSLAEGEHIISVIGRDQAGNWQAEGSATTYTWTVDTVKPDMPTITSIAGDESDYKINNAEKAAIIITGTAEANSLVSVSLTSGVTVTGTQQLTSENIAYSITIDGATLSDGTVNVSVIATDAANNTSDPAATASALKDTIAPAFTINDDVDADPVQTDTINITVTEINLATSKYGFSADNICNADDTIDIDFTSELNFFIEGNHIDYLCVKAVDTAGNTTYQLVGQLNTDNTDPEVTLYSQFTDQTLIGGNIYPLSWTATDINLGVNPIGLEYSTDNGENWAVIAENTENDGAYNWVVPKLNSSNCYIRVIATDLADNATQEKSDTFAISYSETVDIAPPTVAVNSPNGGETLEAGSTHVITWTANDDTTPANDLSIGLEYSLDGSATWNSIIGNTENDGVYIWTTPAGENSDNCLVRVSTEDASNSTGSDISNSVFSIAEVITVPESICTDLENGQWTCAIGLSEGWNLISLPVILDNTDTDIGDVLDGVSNINNVELVKYYDSNADDNWLDYVPTAGTAGTGDLLTMEDGKGYWVKMHNPDVLTVTGIEALSFPDPSPTYEVIQEWNLIGLKSTSARMLSSTYLRSLNGNYILVDENNINRNDGYMYSGKGYWLWMNQVGSIVTFKEE